MLIQEGQVVSYASRSLTDVESRYSQTEPEMLAVVFGVEKFHIYLHGSTFTVITDHKPLLGIIGSCRPTSVRIDRWRLRLMPYEFTLIYRPGKDAENPADYLSRHPRTKPSRHNDGENYVNYVANTALPNALSLEEVRKETKQDRVLVAVMTSISTGMWNSRLVSHRFPEVEIVKSTSAHATVPKIISMFSRFGTPSVLKTDNGAPFNGKEFSIFAQKYGFKHRKITPLWPEANGEAERFVQSLNKFVHTC
ncbi:transposon ty3-g Gag-Pol polyprotein [Plakobranchus ocellatus]|uniref:Transposon ty3-g Gag-Pol polyprotein n=1 Tax=Plakobranchus ocellatus TaxID=259542 RepID=A0AAV4A4D0_9GAST|nr:transposon ty3-g Gag-Pol polyprotein [Plakobranchus ocellatus]